MNESLEIASRLKPIRLPSEFATFGPLDCLVIFGLGLLIGLAAVMMLRLFMARVPSCEERVRATLSELQSAPADVCLLKLARLHAELDAAGARPPWRDALYRPDFEPDFAGIESEILDVARRRVK
jgi:hypothetical protein